MKHLILKNNLNNDLILLFSSHQIYFSNFIIFNIVKIKHHSIFYLFIIVASINNFKQLKRL